MILGYYIVGKNRKGTHELKNMIYERMGDGY